VTEKGQELVSQAQEQTKDKAKELTNEAGYQLKDQVDHRSTQAGEQIQSIGSALRQSSKQLREEGKGAPAKAVDQVAQRADDLGSYLQSADADKILGDVETFARRRPWLTAAAGAVAGLMAARFMKASSGRRYASSHQRALPSGGDS
jgi:ElaB/YqjD/DUF883 family membrane-anchored ribosome-binding protein